MNCMHLAAASILIAATAPAQQTTIVRGGGSALAQAVTIANVGDTLIVRAATYDGVFLNKGITILCDPGVTIADGSVAPLHVANVPANETAVVRAVRLDRTTGVVAEVLRITNCAGTVVLDDVVDASSFPFARMRFENCTGPVFAHGLIATDPWSIATVDQCAHVAFADSPSNPTVYSINSAVHLTKCTIPPRVNNVAAVEIANGTAAITDCDLSGAPATASFWWSYPGIGLYQSGEITIAGNTSIRGGVNLTNASAIEATHGIVRMAPSVRLIATGVPVTSGNGSFIIAPLPTLRAPGVASGSFFTVTVDAQVGSFTATLLNRPSIPPITLPFGTAWIAIQSPALDSGIVPATGMRTANLLIPQVAVATPIVLQAVTLTITGQILIGPPVSVLLN